MNADAVTPELGKRRDWRTNLVRRAQALPPGCHEIMLLVEHDGRRRIFVRSNTKVEELGSADEELAGV